MFLILVSVSGLNRIILFMWFKNFGLNLFCKICIIFDFNFGEILFFLVFLSNKLELIFDVIIIIVFLKLIN